MRYLSILLLFAQLLPFSSSDASPLPGTVQGLVVDNRTGEPLPGANILLVGTQRGTATNTDGQFTLNNVEAGTIQLTISMIGYTTTTIEDINVSASQTSDIGTIRLERSSISLKEITVTPGNFSIMGSAGLSQQTLTQQDIKNMSWAEDVTRAVARLPGISSSDFSSKFAIRGGESDEVLITLDGMELYEPFHQRDFSGGLFSIVDIETIDGIDLMTGGYSAEYGNRLSGVFNMRTKNVAKGQKNTSVGLSFLTARFYSDGSFGDGKGSYIFSARRGMLDVLFNAVSAVEENTIDQAATPGFYDLMAKVDYQLSPKQTLSFHALHAGDKTNIDDVDPDNGDFDKNDTKYGNTYGWATLKSSLAPNLFAQTLLYTGFISHDRNGSFLKNDPGDKGTFSLRDQRSYSFIGLKQDWHWDASSNLILSGGFEAKQLNADYDYLSTLSEIRVNQAEEAYTYNFTRDLQIKPSGQQVGAHVTGRFKVLPKMALETGLRFDKATYTGDELWSPRIGLAYALTDHTMLRGAWGYYHQSQFLNNLDINHGVLTFDPAELAKHYVLGLEHQFANGIDLRMEAYYKDLSNYSPQWQNLRDHLEIFPEIRNDNALVVLDGATSKGIEFFLKRDTGDKISWWLSYALASAEDDIQRIDFDGFLTTRTGKVPRLNDQPHTIFADVNYRPNKKWHFNLSWSYYKGWPRTNYTFEYLTLPEGNLQFYAIHQDLYATLYPAYHRMDLRTNGHFTVKKGNVSVFLHLINLYNRENLKKFDLDTRDDAGAYSLDAQGNYVEFRDDKYWFGFMPVLGASWTF